MILTYARSQALVLPSSLASSGRSAASNAWIRRDLTFYSTTTCYSYYNHPFPAKLLNQLTDPCKERVNSVRCRFTVHSTPFPSQCIVNMGHRAEGSSGIYRILYFLKGMQSGSKSNK